MARDEPLLDGRGDVCAHRGKQADASGACWGSATGRESAVSDEPVQLLELRRHLDAVHITGVRSELLQLLLRGLAGDDGVAVEAGVTTPQLLHDSSSTAPG